MPNNIFTATLGAGSFAGVAFDGIGHGDLAAILLFFNDQGVWAAAACVQARHRE